MEKDNVLNEDGTLENCPIEYFGKLGRAELKHFILAHDPNVESPKQMPKNKGDTKMAQELLESRGYDAPLELIDPTILWTFKCRCEPIKDEWNISIFESIDGSDEMDEGDNTHNNIAVAGLLLNDAGRNALPSELLSSDLCVSFSCRLFGIDRPLNSPASSISTEQKRIADMLVKILRVRMYGFMNRRIVSKERSKHSAIQLANKNLSVVAAYMVLADHVKTDLSCLDQSLDQSKSLLTPNNNKFKPCQQHINNEGAYLDFDSNNGIFIRSGKVCRRGFGKRHSEHLREASRAMDPKSDFYLWFPTSDCVQAQSKSKGGLFEKLTQYIAAGFDPKSEEASLVDRSSQDGGVMILDGTDSSNIKASMKQSPNDLFKFQSFMPYLFEFGYDLAIGSFGFESFVGLFGVYVDS